MLVEFTSEHLNYLNTHLSMERKDLLNLLESNNVEGSKFELDENQMCEIRDWANERLIKVGFDENYELREEGKTLEGLVDFLFV